MASSWGKHSTGASEKSIVPGYTDGLKTLGLGIIGMEEGHYEQKQSIYNLKEQIEEDKLFKINSSVRNLLKDLKEQEETPTGIKDENKA